MSGESDSVDRVDLRVAQRLRELRGERTVTLTALAEQVGISAAHLSRLEKGERQPSIGTLLQLARVYRVSVSDLVEDRPEKAYHLLRACDEVAHSGSGGRYTVLSGPRSNVAVIRVELVPGRRTEAATHAGEEWLHVRAGRIVLTLDDEVIELADGDSIQFDAALTHRLACADAGPASVLIVSAAQTGPMHHPVPGGGRPARSAPRGRSANAAESGNPD